MEITHSVLFGVKGGFFMIAGAEWLIHEAGGAWCGVSYSFTYIGPQLVKIVLWVAFVGSNEIAVQVVIIN